MNQSIEISMMVLALVRIIGLVAFIDFYIHSNNILFIRLIAAFIFYILSPLSYLFIEKSDIFSFLYGVTATIGIYFIALTSFSFIRNISNKAYIYGFILLTLISSSFYLFFHDIPSLLYTVIPQMMILLSMIIFTILNLKEYKLKGGSSVNYIFAIMIAGIGHTLCYLFVYSEKGIEYSYILTIGLSVLIILYFIHLQYNHVNNELAKQNKHIKVHSKEMDVKNKEIEKINLALNETNNQLQRTVDLMVGRENKMIELKKEIESLRNK